MKYTEAILSNCDLWDSSIHRHFSHGVLLLHSLEICLKWDTVFRQIICIWVVLSCSVFVQKTSKALKTLKPFKNLKKTTFLLKSRFFLPALILTTKWKVNVKLTLIRYNGNSYERAEQKAPWQYEKWEMRTRFALEGRVGRVHYVPAISSTTS